MKKYMYTYKIICLKGSFKGKYYYGQHSTNNLDDGYKGSGTLLRSYYKKYGAIEGETYTKSILQFFNNLDELNKAEEMLIGDKYETDENCLNCRRGGDKMTLCTESLNMLKTHNKNKTTVHKNDKELRVNNSEVEMFLTNGWVKGQTDNHRKNNSLGQTGKTVSEITKKHLSENHWDCSGDKNPMYGKNFKEYMTEDALKTRNEKISAKNKGKQFTKGKHWYKDKNTGRHIFY